MELMVLGRSQPKQPVSWVPGRPLSSWSLLPLPVLPAVTSPEVAHWIGFEDRAAGPLGRNRVLLKHPIMGAFLFASHPPARVTYLQPGHCPVEAEAGESAQLAPCVGLR